MSKMTMYDLRAEKFCLRIIPYGNDPFCVAYVGEEMITVTDQEKAWSTEVPEGKDRFDFLIYYLYDHMLMAFDDPQDLVPMTNRQNYSITEVDEEYMNISEPTEEKAKPDLVSETKQLLPSEQWFTNHCVLLDSLISEVTEELDREQEERIAKREAWELGIINALEEERNWMKPLLEFHIPKVVGIQELAF